MIKQNIVKYKDNIIPLLEKEGFSRKQIDVMLNDYTLYEKEYSEVSPKYSNLEQYASLMIKIRNASLHRPLNEALMLVKRDYPKSSKAFCGLLKTTHLKMAEALSLFEYTAHSSDILRQYSARDNSNGTPNYVENSMNKLKYLSMQQYEPLLNYAKNIDINKNPEEFKNDIENLCKKVNAPFLVVYNTMTTILNKKISTTKLSSSIKTILKNQIAQNTIVHRGVTMPFLNKLLPSDDDKVDFNSLIGKKIEEKGFTSTSLIYNSSFAGSLNENDYPVYLQIYVPKGSEGMNISPFSKYSYEHEFLCNANDLHIFDVDKNYIDENGNNKILLKCLLLSKDKECYKDIAQSRERKHTSIAQNENNSPAENV